MELALVALRLIQFASAMVLLGAPALAWALGFCLPAASPLWAGFERDLRHLLVAAAVAALVSGLLWLDLEAAIMGNGWPEALDPATIRTVLSGTVFGHAWIWHLGLGTALVAVLAAPLPRRLWVPLVTVIGAAFLTNLAWAGHAVMTPGPLHLLVQAVHLLAGGLWLGSLPALFHLLARALRDRPADLEAALGMILPLYSRAGYVAVALVLLTGILNSAFLVGSLAALATTAFGRVLLVKIALVLGLIGIAAANRLLLRPAIVAGKCGGLPLARLVRNVGFEQGLALLVLAAVSVLGTLPPAISP